MALTVVNKFLFPIVTVIGATISGTAVGLIPRKIFKGDDNSITFYKKSKDGLLKIGNGFYDEQVLPESKRIIRLGNEQLEHKENTLDNAQKNSLQLTGDTDEKTPSDWIPLLSPKTYKDPTEKQETGGGSTTIYIKGINCKDFNERFLKSQIKERGIFKNNDRNFGFFGDGWAMWGCHESERTVS